MDFYMLQPGRWTGLVEVPGRPGWPAGSPVLVTAVTPLKSGLGRLALEFLQPIHPGGGQVRKLVVRVVQKTPDHLTCVYDEEGEERTAILACPDFAWLEQWAPELLRRRSVSGMTLIANGEMLGSPSWEEHLARVFGDDRDEILHGANRKSFPVKRGRMPKERTQLTLGVELDPLDSCLVSRGVKPHQMEDKWFVLHEKNRLLFRRSWTGNLIYDVEAYWRGDRLYLGCAFANREPSQYQETDDAYDTALLRYVIDVVLRGVVAGFPVKPEDANAPLQAWSVTGAASLG